MGAVAALSLPTPPSAGPGASSCSYTFIGQVTPCSPPPSHPLLQRSAPSGFGHGGEDAQPMHALDLLAQRLQQMNIRAESHRNTKAGALKSRAPHSGPCSPALRALT